MSRWHYRPYQLNGLPVEVQSAVEVNFKLPNFPNEMGCLPTIRIATTNKAWDLAVQQGIQPTVQKNGNCAYGVHYPEAGLGWGVDANASGNPILNNVKIITSPDSRTVVTALPFNP